MIPLLPIELLIFTDMLDEFKHVLLSYNFRKTLASKVARFGNYKTMLWFQSNALTLNESVLVSAAQRGDIQLFESIWNDINNTTLEQIWNFLDLAKYITLRLDAFKGAAQFGHLDFLIYAERTSKLHLENPDEAITVLIAASKHGHLNILEWYKEQSNAPFSFQRTEKMFSAAVVGNKMNVLVWLKSFLDVQSWESFVRVSVHPYVSIHGNKDLVMWLIEQGFESDFYSASAAATAGSIDLLKFFSHRWSAHVYTKAAEKGHLALLQ